MVKWVHHVYNKDSNFWEYEARKSASWAWKSICKIKEIVKAGYGSFDQWLDGEKPYTTKEGYKWLNGQLPKVG